MKPFKKKIENLINHKLPPNKTVVFVVEEFGCRLWIWVVDMNWKKLEKWWENLERIDKFNMRVQFRKVGEIIELYPHRKYNILSKIEGKCHHAHVFDDTDSYLVSPKWYNDKAIYHKYYDEANRILNEDLKEQIDGDV